MIHKHKRHPKNVPGDFYVEDGCCTMCMVPEVYAPNLIAYDIENSHCYVAKQPTNEDELYQAIKAVWAAEAQCIRYAGKDLNILKRFAEIGETESCDNRHYVLRISPLLRNHVTFDSSTKLSETELAQHLEDYISSDQRTKFSRIKTDKFGATFSFSWYENKYYSIWFKRIESQNVWHVFHSPAYEEIGSRSISLQIDDWLRNSDNFNNIRWYSNKNWNKAIDEWQSTTF